MPTRARTGFSARWRSRERTCVQKRARLVAHRRASCPERQIVVNFRAFSTIFIFLHPPIRPGRRLFAPFQRLGAQSAPEDERQRAGPFLADYEGSPTRRSRCISCAKPSAGVRFERKGAGVRGLSGDWHRGCFGASQTIDRARRAGLLFAP